MRLNRLPPLNAVRAFESVARNQSVSKAAEELCVSQSTVSQHIKNLEEWFSCKLFARASGRMIPTADAMILQRDYRKAFDLISRSSLAFSDCSSSYTLKIHAESAFAAKWLRPRLHAFLESMPEVNVHITTDNDDYSGIEQDTDVVIHYRTRNQKHAYAIHDLADIEGFPACSPSLYEKYGEVKDANDLKKYPLIFDYAQFSWQRWFGACYGIQDLFGYRGVTYDNFAMAIDAAKNSEGVLIADNITCHEDLVSGELVPLIQKKIYTCTYHLSILNHTPQVDSFYQWIQSEIYKTKTTSHLNTI